VTDGPSWSSSAPHRWPKKGERRLASPAREEQHPVPKRIEDCKPGDVVWWEAPRQEDGLDKPTCGKIISFEEEHVRCEAADGRWMLVPYEAIATSERGLRRLLARRDMARSSGGF